MRINTQTSGTVESENEYDGIVMTGRLTTQVTSDPWIYLTGYGPSTSTIGANRTGRAVADELI